MLAEIDNLDELEFIDETELEDKEEPTLTFAINTNENVIGGMIDDLEALKQSIYLTLNTEADQHIIYHWTYGLQTIDLIGKPSYYVMAVLPDRIKEALLDDDRITDVSEFEFKINNNKITVSFIVSTIYGENIEEEMVVIY
jgi:hypothetical protein